MTQPSTPQPAEASKLTTYHQMIVAKYDLVQTAIDNMRLLRIIFLNDKDAHQSIRDIEYKLYEQKVNLAKELRSE